MEYFQLIGFKICLYIILVLSINLTAGIANLLTMCQAAFFGLGAFSGAIILSQFDMPFVAMALLVMVITGLTSLLVSFASMKLKGDYFILATLGFQMIVFYLIYNWNEIVKLFNRNGTTTDGLKAISGIPSIKLFGTYSLNGASDHLIFALAVTTLVILFFVFLQRLPYGRILRAIRMDELSVKALGRNTAGLKTWAFFISAAFAGLAGLMYVSSTKRMDPSWFTMDESLFILTALFIGGSGSRVWGPIAGAVIGIVLPSILSEVGLPDMAAANVRQIIFGLALIVMLFLRPQGLLGDSKLE